MRTALLLLLLILLNLPARAQQLSTADSTLSGNITRSTTLSASKRYLLSGFVKVKSGATLTIPAGTVLYGEKATKGTLIIERGAKIMAEGTATQPVVLTSQVVPGQRAAGDWGGLIIAGKATINIEGGVALLEGGTETQYGGGTSADDNDNSGVLRYVRIEYPGIAFQTNNEINGLTMGGVGRGTTCENIQVSFSNDDAFEWFGGTVNCRNLIAIGSLDDDLDVDNGFSGNIQNVLVVRDPLTADVSGSNGIEADNDAAGSTASPRTTPTFSNLTIIGPAGFGLNVNSNFKRGAHLRRSSRVAIFNSIIVGFPDAINLDGANVIADAQSGEVEIQHSLFSGAYKKTETTATAFDPAAWFSTTAYGNAALADQSGAQLTNVYGFFTQAGVSSAGFDPRPASGSPAIGSADFSDARLQNAFFTPTAQSGAFARGSEPWYRGWANFNPLSADYSTGVTTDAPADQTQPERISLDQNYPNPFNPSTQISFTVDKTQHVRLAVYDIIGREVAVLIDGMQPAGAHQVRFDAGNLASGLYLYRLEAEGTTLARGMNLIK